MLTPKAPAGLVKKEVCVGTGSAQDHWLKQQGFTGSYLDGRYDSGAKVFHIPASVLEEMLQTVR